jgi:CHAD domain-containing protein
MAFRLAGGEGAAHGVRRVAGEQLDRAITELTDGVRTDPVDAVHAARKALKKERSVLRLARGSMKPKARRRENATFRDAGRRLSAARDAEVMVEALDGLAERYAGRVPAQTFTTIRDHLQAAGEGPRQSLMDSGLTGEVAETLKAARVRTGQWRFKRGGWKTVSGGLDHSYRRGRRAFMRAQADPTTESLHDWRKRAKDHWYHLRLLQPVAPGTIKGQAKDAHLLSDVLGDDHDLALLRERLLEAGPALPVDLDPVIALLDHRRGQLQAEAMWLGERLYAEKPKAFLRRIHAYWKAWRAQTGPAVSEHPARLAGMSRQRAAT